MEEGRGGKRRADAGDLGGGAREAQLSIREQDPEGEARMVSVDQLAKFDHCHQMVERGTRV